ncbi:hypothetical protein JNW88_30575, partial [Micromonospora sp. ATA32]|nr:hypothetical protein [Micromonospora sp. ATA32]
MRERLVPHGVAAAVTAVVLAPLALPGYVLRYDMVFVPRQPLSWDVIAPASALPRAVPQDAVVALATGLVPGWLVQRLALVAILYLAALGAAGWCRPDGRRSGWWAALGYAWTPYLAERLLIGQWGAAGGVRRAALAWSRQAIGVRLGSAGRAAPAAAGRRGVRDHPDRWAARARGRGGAAARPLSGRRAVDGDRPRDGAADQRTLVTGLFVAALVSVPVLALLVATSGLVVTAGA